MLQTAIHFMMILSLTLTLLYPNLGLRGMDTSLPSSGWRKNLCLYPLNPFLTQPKGQTPSLRSLKSIIQEVSGSGLFLLPLAGLLEPQSSPLS